MTLTTKELVYLLADALADLAGWTWAPGGGAYAPADVGIYYGPIPHDSTTRAVGITVYDQTSDIQDGLAQARVQLRFRGSPEDPSGGDELADTAFGVLHKLSRYGKLNLVVRSLTAPLGTDENARQERADSYNITIDTSEV